MNKMKLKQQLTKFRNDKRGIAWVLGTAVVSLFIMPIIYFPLSYAWDQVYAAITSGYTFTGTSALAITAVQMILSYLMAFGVLFTIVWASVQAKKSRYT